MLPPDNSDTTVKNLIWQSYEVKRLASTNKSDKTVTDLIWLHNDTLDHYYC